MKVNIELRMIHHSVIGSTSATDWPGNPPSTETNPEPTAAEPAIEPVRVPREAPTPRMS